MQYRQYGNDGPQVSRLGFGAMRLPAKRSGEWGSVNFAQSTRVIRAALEGGVNLIDSHHNYHGGMSEEAIGRALKGWKGHRVYIQTKSPFYRDEPIHYFETRLAEALEKLGVDCIDYLFFHSMNMEMFKRRHKAFIKFTDWAIKRGMIKRRGFSSHATVDQIKQFIDTGEFSACLLTYNWLSPEMGEAIAYAADKGMGVSVMNPVGGGHLAANSPMVTRLIRGAKSGPEVGIRFALSTPGVMVAMSGMSNIEQVTENVRTASRKTTMTPRQREIMAQRLVKMENDSSAICTSCGYCMPCPHGVTIPENFLLLSRAKLFGITDWARYHFKRIQNDKKTGDRSALACRQCGLCIPKCPNDIPIIEQLRETADLLAE